jgi:membrane-bound ClpP family serine protease
VVLLALSLAAALLVVEVALPTMGVAGTLSLALAVLGIAAIDRQQADWWPLAGPAVAVVLWAVLVAARRRSVLLEALAGVLFAAGAVGFGVAQSSAGTAVLGVVLAAVLVVDYPRVHAAADRLAGQPAQVGMEALVGLTGTVAGWSDRSGTVRVQGSLWNAVSGAGDVGAKRPEVGDEIEVVGWSGMTVQVARRARQAS